MGEPTKKDYPPGWNDPPMLNYNSTNPPPKSRITNRRVAFPLGSSPVTKNDTKPLEPPQMPSLSPLSTESDTQCVETLYLKASENFNKLLADISDENIKEQIWQMLHAWQSRKLSVNSQNTLTELSSNIVECNTAKVNEIHLQLMVDSSPLIKTYLPALKYLITFFAK